ncbi:MAG: hypothetical protein H5U30_08830 [Marinobacter sp.]|nr:hypothetical protein [Marinobacter sp.]
MADLTLQRVFDRVFSYLTESGVEMTQAHSRKLLQLMDDSLATGEGLEALGAMSETRLLARAMDLVPVYFPVAVEKIPAPNPPMCRGSIGYPSHG